MLHRCYHLSPRARLASEGGRHVLLCDHPLQAVTLNASAALLLRALRPGAPLHDVATGVPPETVEWLDGLVARGLLRATYHVTPPDPPPAVEVIIPCFANPTGLQRCLAGLSAQTYPGARLRVSVVDDGSPHPLATIVAAPPGLTLRWLRLAENAGPGAARHNAVETPWPDGQAPALLAFLDSDCVPAPGWLTAIAGLLEDPLLACVGGKVAPLRCDSLLARYEGECSSLYLGPQAGPVATREVPRAYLPACNLALRRDVYLKSGGFRRGWRFGEDVDLCWRLAAGGHRLLYHPEAEVAHDHRVRWWPFLMRRRAYARSEAPLQRAHPDRPRRPPGVAIPLALLAAAAGLATGHGTAWAAAGALLIAHGALQLLRWRHPRGGEGMPTALGMWRPRTIGAALARRSAATLLQWCRHLSRQGGVWLVLVLVGAVPTAPAVAVVPVAILAGGALGERLARRPRIGWGTFAVGYGAECLAYSVGRAEGVLGQWLRGT